MSVNTTYDEMRDKLRDKVKECVEIARDLLDESIWGYEDMREDYAIEIYTQLLHVKKMI